MTCFIHFGFSHCLDNIRLLKCVFVVFYLFIVFACELIWNELLNQKGFLYITQIHKIVNINVYDSLTSRHKTTLDGLIYHYCSGADGER